MLNSAVWEISGQYAGSSVKLRTRHGDDVVVRHGTGKFDYPNSYYSYEGEWNDNAKDGKGRLTFGADEENYYEGDFKAGEITGRGTRRWPNGDSYSGQFVRGEMSGQGVLITSSFEYQGGFDRNSKSGRGELRWKNGDYYEGNFSRNYPDGQGEFTSGDGKRTYNGDWRRRELWIVSDAAVPLFDKYPQPFVTANCTGQLKKGASFAALETRNVWLRTERGWIRQYDAKGNQCVALVSRKGARHGNGVERSFAERDGTREIESEYKGAFVDDRREGSGVWRHSASGYTYDGLWRRGRPVLESWYLKLVEEKPADGEDETKNGDENADAKGDDAKGNKPEDDESATRAPALVPALNPLLVCPGETVALRIAVCNYDGTPNRYESGRAIICSVAPKSGEEDAKEDAEQPVDKYVFTVDLPESADKENAEKATKGGLQESPVQLQDPGNAVVLQKYVPDEDGSAEEKAGEASKEDGDGEAAAATPRLYPSVVVPQGRGGCAVVQNFTFSADLATGTELTVTLVDQTPNLPEALRVGKGRPFTQVFSVVDQKAKDAAAKAREKARAEKAKAAQT